MPILIQDADEDMKMLLNIIVNAMESDAVVSCYARPNAGLCTNARNDVRIKRRGHEQENITEYEEREYLSLEFETICMILKLDPGGIPNPCST
jgi:hypothetical protein